MTDYSNIVDDEIVLLRDPIDSGCAQRSVERLLLRIDAEGEVRLGERTYYGGDMTPADEWHMRTLTYRLAVGPCVVDVERLRIELGEGGLLSELIDRVIAGHTVTWDGNNHRGRLDEDAQEAHEELAELSDDADRYMRDDMEVCDAEEWLRGSPAVSDQYLLDSAGLTVDSSAKDIAAAAEALNLQARNDGVVLLDCEAALEASIARVKAAAAEEAA